MEKQQLTSTETGRRLQIKWTAPKGFAALILFFAVGVIFEILLISAFQTLGLTDPNAWTSTVLIPSTNWSFTVSLSVMFHLLPLSVIVVLLASWTYLTKLTAFIPKREAARRIQPLPRRAQEGGRLRSARRLWRNLSRRFQRLGRSLKAGVQRIPGVSPISERLSFARVAVRTAFVILGIAVSIALLLFLVEYPDLIYHLTVNLYRGSPGFLQFVQGIGQWFNGIGTAVPPLGYIGASINNALINGAAGFRQSLQAVGTSLSAPIVSLDVASKYALSQNLAAWTGALLVLLYGSYTSTSPRRRVRGR